MLNIIVDHKINMAKIRQTFGSAVIVLNHLRWNAKKSLQEIWSFELWFKGIFKEYVFSFVEVKNCVHVKVPSQKELDLKICYTFPEVKTMLRLCTNTFISTLQNFLSQIALTVFEIRSNSTCLKWCSKTLTEIVPCGAVGFQSAIPFIDITYFLTHPERHSSLSFK